MYQQICRDLMLQENWLLCVVFGMLNAAGINYYIINRDNRARRGMAIINRQ